MVPYFGYSLDPNDMFNLPQYPKRLFPFTEQCYAGIISSQICYGQKMPSLIKNGQKQLMFGLCQGDFTSPSLLASYCLIQWATEIIARNASLIF